MKQQSDRQRVIDIAHTFLGTPYHHHGRIKGVGVDCLTLIAGVYEEAGFTGPIAIPEYPFQWNLNRGDELYLEGLLRYAKEIEQPQPADIVIWKIGRTFSHAAIVINWPTVIHSLVNCGVVLENVESAQWLMFDGKRKRPRRFFSYWGH